MNPQSRRTKTALVVGASRGLGLEFARQLAETGWRTVATARGEPDRAASGIEWRELDAADHTSVGRFLDGWGDVPLDLLVYSAGLTDRPSSLGQLDTEAWAQVLRVNTIAPVQLVEGLRGPLARAAPSWVVALSSELASIGPLSAESSSWRSRGAYYAYRTSKAALNAAVRLVALELAAMGIGAVAVDPGWVRTDMGGRDAPLEPAAAVARVLALVMRLGPEHSGAFVRADGSPIPY